MISDVLSDAVLEIERYLRDFRTTYTGDLRARIVAVLDQMEAVRRELDTPPSELENEDDGEARLDCKS